jgi:hypothetical protein
MNIEKDYRDKVIQVWKQFGEKDFLTDVEYHKYPLLPKEVQKNSLLFIGINPSFGKGAIVPENEKPIGFYPKQENEDIKDIPYFEKFKEIANYCDSEWTHLDLLFLRETNQKIIERLSKEEVPFINAQLDISFDIIRRAEPKLIIVSNAFASEYFGKKKNKHAKFQQIWQGFDLSFEDNKKTFDSSIGTYRINFGQKNIPIIFSGMLSGQRALDLGSFERLKWQIKFILENKKVN